MIQEYLSELFRQNRATTFVTYKGKIQPSKNLGAPQQDMDVFLGRHLLRNPPPSALQFGVHFDLLLWTHPGMNQMRRSFKSELIKPTRLCAWLIETGMRAWPDPTAAVLAEPHLLFVISLRPAVGSVSLSFYRDRELVDRREYKDLSEVAYPSEAHPFLWMS